MAFESDVFVNCPFDPDFAPLLEAMLFCIVYLKLNPRLATERLEAGANRFDKIFELAKGSRFSIHDLSRCKSARADEFFRMNMPFELGLDFGIRRCGVDLPSPKKFLIFENEPYETKRTLSDLAGVDVEFHRNDYQLLIKKTRDFFRTEAEIAAPGPAKIKAEYETFLGWLTEKKIAEGHSEKEALSLPTSERLDEMKTWVAEGCPPAFSQD